MTVKSNDIKASIVVALVALPLCLGIALASNAPLSAGILAGIIGGVVIGWLGGSEISVSGPAAGLTVIVAAAISELGGFPQFALAVALAGALQLAMGYVKAGELGNFFPVSVIKGMLAAIGLILILKQLPHAIGWDTHYMGEESFGQLEGDNTFSNLLAGLKNFHTGTSIIALTSLGLMLLWDKILIKKIPKLSFMPSALLAVLWGISLNELFKGSLPVWAVQGDHLVSLPFQGGFNSLISEFRLPQWQGLLNPLTWKVALTLAVVASLETLLSLDAADKIDPLKRTSGKNKELRAQGVGNLLAGLVGALPMTAVIVRTTANASSGALTRSSAIFHGIWLLLAVVLFPAALNLIPLSVLAIVLILVGWKLTLPSLYIHQWRLGWSQFVPFLVTILAILFTDLLIGIGVGLLVGVVFVLKSNLHSSVIQIKNSDTILIRFAKDVSFLQKARIRAMLREVPNHTNVIIDGSRSIHVDHDIVELVQDFQLSSSARHIQVSIQKSPLALHPFFKE